MLSRTMFTIEYIHQLRENTGYDPQLLERVIYAFGLLEAIRKVELPFCFKGGTSLMLLLEHPKRLSTDIDIIVEPGIDIEEYISKAGTIFPFRKVEEIPRTGNGNIQKRHFRFIYQSPESNRDVTILLDVLFENILYETIREYPIRNDLLITEGEDLSVLAPNANGLLADKLTAFAPHTTGIPFGERKELEIIKQLFDCSGYSKLWMIIMNFVHHISALLKQRLNIKASVSSQKIFLKTQSEAVYVLQAEDNILEMNMTISRMASHASAIISSVTNSMVRLPAHMLVGYCI